MLAGQAIAVSSRTGTTGSITYYYLFNDHLGSASTMTATAGSVVHQARFLPFGGSRGWGSAPTTAWLDRGYTRHLHNDEVGLIYMNARYYVPSLGRFASADTILPDEVDPQAWNRYSYVRNNPLIYNDPSGHCWGIASGMRDWNFLNYGTTCSNMDMAWNIVTHPEATLGERASAGAYLAAEGLAHAGVVAGGTVAAVGCVVATSGICGGVGATAAMAAGTGSTVAGGACADGDCTNEATMAARGVSNVVQAISADGDPTNEIDQLNRAYGMTNPQLHYLRNTNLYNHFNVINERLSVENIKTIAFRLNIDHEMLATSGAGKGQYTYALLRYLNETKSIQQLNNLLLEYPHLKDEIIQLMQ